MRIGILTWHKALNHGAILQVYASQKYIKKLGYETLVLDHERKVSNKDSLGSRLSKIKIKLRTGDFRYKRIYRRINIEKRILFDEFVKTELSLGKNCTEEQLDCLMVGSDMVFNLIQGYSDYMFGKGINTRYIFSYAACAGGSTDQLAKRMGIADEIRDRLLHFNGLGCRDQSTIDFVRSICGRNDCVENIDPVLLYGFDDEIIKWDTGKWKAHSRYLLVYSYHGYMNDRAKYKQIRYFAEVKGLTIVSCGYFHPWCDENINAGPKEFLEMFVHAEYIITDTFHGTVFSLLNHKRFCSIICQNGFKLEYLLRQCGLEKRIASEEESINDILDSEVDYSNYDAWIQREREQSTRYLCVHLKQAEEG